MKTMEVRNTAKVAVIILGLVAALGITSLCITENAWADQKENETHQIAIAADRYGNESAIAEAMKGMPKDVEYVSLVGDMAGSDSDRRSEYNSSDILDEVKGVGFTGLGSAEQASDEVSILWADNDENVQDDAGIVFGYGGEESGLMKIGYNADGSVAYYIYGIWSRRTKPKPRRRPSVSGSTPSKIHRPR